jgi:hypothetical protein
LLTFELREDIAQRLSARLQGLGQPCTHLRPFQFMDNQGRIAQDPAEILPDQIIQGASRRIAGGATLAEGEPQRVGAAPTEIIMVARMQSAATTRQPTLPTAHQPTQ